MPQGEILALVELVSDRLMNAKFDVYQFVLDEKYIDTLATEISGNDGSQETAHLSYIMANVLRILSTAVYDNIEFNKVIVEITRSHNSDLTKIKKVLNYNKQIICELEERLHHVEQQDHDVAQYLENLQTLRVSQRNSPFAYDYYKMQDIWGRDTQIRKMCLFAEDSTQRFLFCVITGPAGVGKSKLAFHFGCIYQSKKDWLVYGLNRKPLEELSKKNNWDTEKNILFIIDSANEQDSLSDLLSKLCMLEKNRDGRKIRLVLIAREGTSPSEYLPHERDFPQWYTDILHENSAIGDHLFSNEFIELEGLTLKDCGMIHVAYATNYLKKKVLLADEEKVTQWIERAVMGEDGFIRPLYALFVIDLYYRNPNTHSWNLASLQEQIFIRDWDKWKIEISGKRNKREDVFISLINLLQYATIFGKWESNTILPKPLDTDCETVNKAALAYAKDYKSKWFKTLTGKSVKINGESVLLRLTPDVVGEYFVLKRLSMFDNPTLEKWASLMIAHIVDCKDFFVRAIQDFGNDKTFIFIFLKLFGVMERFIPKGDVERHSAFSSILEALFLNYKGNDDDRIYQHIREVIKQYIGLNMNFSPDAAELELLFHKNDPHIGCDSRLDHLKAIEPLYRRWPKSLKITSAYISFLGDVVASRVGANIPGYTDLYVIQFEKTLEQFESPDYVIKKALIPVLIKIIKRADSVNDWCRSRKFEKCYLEKIVMQSEDDLALDCINRFDSAIIALAKQHADIIHNNKSAKEVDQRLQEEISFFIRVINDNASPSDNFVWTYVGKFAMITKNLCIHRCEPVNELIFQYMLTKLQEVHTTYSESNESSILPWRVRRVLEDFCDVKSDAVSNSSEDNVFYDKVMDVNQRLNTLFRWKK